MVESRLSDADCPTFIFTDGYGERLSKVIARGFPLGLSESFSKPAMIDSTTWELSQVVSAMTTNTLPSWELVMRQTLSVLLLSSLP